MTVCASWFVILSNSTLFVWGGSDDRGLGTCFALLQATPSTRGRVDPSLLRPTCICSLQYSFLVERTRAVKTRKNQKQSKNIKMLKVCNENRTDAANIRPKYRRDVFLRNRYSIIRDCYFQLSAKARQKEVLEVEKSSASNIWSKFDGIS